MYILYTDGSCNNTKRVGGIGIVLAEPKLLYKELFKGPFYDVTSNMMEVLAAIEGLRMIEVGGIVTVRSDSMYVVGTMLRSWTRRKNQKLWDQLDYERSIRTVTFEHVRGHTGDYYNERADRLALLGRRENK